MPCSCRIRIDHSMLRFRAMRRIISRIHCQLCARYSESSKPGGRWLLVDVVSPEEPMPDTFLNAIEILRDPSHVRDHCVSQWLTMYAAAGFVGRHEQTWSVRLEFTSWVTRMATPEPEVAQLRRMLTAAPESVKQALGIEVDGSFHIPVALISGVVPR
jgi:hypothetical protein